MNSERAHASIFGMESRPGMRKGDRLVQVQILESQLKVKRDLTCRLQGLIKLIGSLYS